jgi:hypothetical protein
MSVAPSKASSTFDWYACERTIRRYLASSVQTSVYYYRNRRGGGVGVVGAANGGGNGAAPAVRGGAGGQDGGGGRAAAAAPLVGVWGRGGGDSTSSCGSSSGEPTSGGQTAHALRFPTAGMVPRLIELGYTIPPAVLKKARVMLDFALPVPVLERLTRLVLVHGGMLVASADQASHVIAPAEMVARGGGGPCVYSPATFMAWFGMKSNTAGKQPTASQ